MAQSVKVFGVDVFVTDPPACAVSAQATEVHAKVNPFEAEAQLADVVTELARRARKAGANTLYGIRILSAAPSQGAEVAASAATCQTPAPASDDRLKSVLSSTRADVLLVRPRDPVGPDRTITNADVTLLKALSADELAKVKAIIAQSQDAPRGPTVKSSCPFVPALGFRFGENGSVWWLVSKGRGCDAAVLLGGGDDWRKVGSVPLPADAAAEIARFSAR